MQLFLTVFLISALIFQAAAWRTYKNDISWHCMEYVIAGLAAVALLYSGSKSDRADIQYDLDGRTALHSQVRESAEFSIQQNLVTLDLMYSYGLGAGNPGNQDYRVDLDELRDRIKTIAAKMQEKTWPDHLEAFYSCDKLKANLTSDTAKSTASSVCETFGRVIATRD